MEKSRKPKIRFKGYNDDWEQRKLGELILEYKKTVDSSCTLPVLTSSKTEGVILQEEHFGRRQQHDITGYNVLPRSFCTYRNRSDGVDFTFNVNECCDMGIISKFYPVFYGNDNDTFFLSLVLNNSDEVVHEIAFTCIGTGQKVLSFLDLQKMSIRVPKQSEQKKISTYFKQLDDLITLHQRKLEKLMNVKKSMLEKMFPKQGSVVPEIRFCGFTDAWEQRELGDCSEIFLGLTYTPKYVDEGKIFISSKDIAKDYLDLSEPKYISEEEFNRSSENAKPKKGDILFTRVGSNLGHPVIIETKEKLCIFVSLGYLRPLNFVHNYYMKYWMCSPDFKTQIFQKTGGGAKVNVNTGWLRKFSFQFSKNIEEQIQIGVFFKNIDNLITLHQRKLEKLKNIKKSMLEKMFI